jgi:hypothetical protein
MADTTTTTYSLVKPEVGASEDTWGAKINTTLDTLDDLFDGTTAIAPNLVGWKVGGTAVTATAAQINVLVATPLIASSNLSDLASATTAKETLGIEAITQVEAEAGTKTTGAMNPLNTAQAIAALTIVPTYQEFLSSGTWTKPAGVKFVYVEVIGGGAGGYNTTITGQVTGGGGGGFNEGLLLASTVGATEAVTIGAGGAGGANSATEIGVDGGDTSFGSLLSGKGGDSGIGSESGADGGGGEKGGYGTTTGVSSGNGGYSSGGGGTGYGRGGSCVKGGAGGAGSRSTVGGTSQSGGNGGSGSEGAGVAGVAGTVPGGGGGGSMADGGGGAGADGRVRVWAW